MRRFILSFSILLLLFSLFADNDDYLLHVRYDPEYLHIQKDGTVEVKFNLPQLKLVKEAYIAVRKDTALYYIMPVTRKNGDELIAIDNIMKFSGQDIVSASESAPILLFSEPIMAADDDFIAAVDDDTELPDEDNDTPLIVDVDSEVSDADVTFILDDAVYACKLVLVMDTSGNGSNNGTTGDDEDSLYIDDDEDDERPVDVPPTVKHTFNVTIDSVAPAAVTNLTAEGGNEKIAVDITPSANNINGGIGEKIGLYYVAVHGLFDKAGVEVEDTVEYTFKTTESTQESTLTATIKGKDSYTLINNDNDEEKYRYLITVYAEDLAGNKDESTAVSLMASAITTYGFWDNYKNSGGTDDGKHCFIATASMGSYSHPRVLILRQFRDIILAKTAVGQAFIRGYYTYSPSIARFISSSSLLRSLVRFILLPLVGMSVILTHPLALIFLFLLLFVIVMRRVSLRKKVLLATIGLLFAFDPSLLSAATVHGEVAFNNSLFLPEKIDDSTSGSPFADIAGDKYRYMGGFLLGFDMPIPEKAHLRLTLRGGMSLTRLRGSAIRADGDISSDKTEAWFYPLMAEVKVRPHYKFPLYPYASFGFDYTFWWLYEGDSLAQAGGTFGFHGSFGIQLSLNWMDPTASRGMKKHIGMRDTMLYAHWRLEKMNDFGKKASWDLSDSRFEFGILFEF
ncbi:hypothetical protein KAH37_07280 [bacterium]|nr:hypothetical protein [bacterium]